MSSLEIGIPAFTELKNLSTKEKDIYWRKNPYEYLKKADGTTINTEPFFYSMKYSTPEQIKILLTNKNAINILIEDLEETNKIINLAFNNYIQIQNNYMKQSAEKAARIAKMDSVKSIIPVYGIIDIAAEKLKRILFGKYKAGSTQKEHMLGICLDFVDITDEFFHKGIENLVLKYLEKTNNLQKFFPKISLILQQAQNQIIDNFKKITERNDKVYKINIENLSNAMKKYNKRLNTRFTIKLLTLGLK